MKLYELTDQYRAPLDQVQDPPEESGDDEPHRALLASLGGAFDEKVLSIAKVIRSLEADVTGLARR